MDSIHLPTERDFRKWVHEALEQFFAQPPATAFFCPAPDAEYLLTRKEIASILRISLVTLHDWMKRGLPYHKQRGRVYFIRAEVLDYVRQHPRKMPGQASI